jgi:hypothetical protein
VQQKRGGADLHCKDDDGGSAADSHETAADHAADKMQQGQPADPGSANPDSAQATPELVPLTPGLYVVKTTYDAEYDMLMGELRANAPWLESEFQWLEGQAFNVQTPGGFDKPPGQPTVGADTQAEIHEQSKNPTRQLGNEMKGSLVEVKNLASDGKFLAGEMGRVQDEIQLLEGDAKLITDQAKHDKRVQDLAKKKEQASRVFTVLNGIGNLLLDPNPAAFLGYLSMLGQILVEWRSEPEDDALDAEEDDLTQRKQGQVKSRMKIFNGRWNAMGTRLRELEQNGRTAGEAFRDQRDFAEESFDAGTKGDFKFAMIKARIERDQELIRRGRVYVEKADYANTMLPKLGRMALVKSPELAHGPAAQIAIRTHDIALREFGKTLRLHQQGVEGWIKKAEEDIQVVEVERTKADLATAGPPRP